MSDATKKTERQNQADRSVQGQTRAGATEQASETIDEVEPVVGTQQGKPQIRGSTPAASGTSAKSETIDRQRKDTS